MIYWTSPTSQNYVFIITSVQSESGINFLMIFGGILDPNALVRRFLLTLVAGSLLTLAIALVGGFWLADRAMRPVKTITQAARTIGETDLSRRLNMKSKDELGELANTFDAMLARLQAAFERQRQFVADASHELRTPLTIVNLETSRAIASRRSPQEYQHALSIIHSENDFMTSLVNDLLMLARMDAGQSVIEKTRLDLSDVAVETLERLTPLATRNGVTLEAGDLPETPMTGDRQYLLQMLSNLVENAIKYTTGVTRRVRVETGKSGANAWVRVSDTGPGIAAEHLPHLFDRFYRVDKARTREADLRIRSHAAQRQRAGSFHRPMDRPGARGGYPGGEHAGQRNFFRSTVPSDRLGDREFSHPGRGFKGLGILAKLPALETKNVLKKNTLAPAF